MTGPAAGIPRCPHGAPTWACNEQAGSSAATEWPSWLQSEWAVLDTLRAHRYDYNNKGDKPDDPGWHACSCGGWQGYWCDYQPHVADRVVSRLEALEDERSEWVERKINHA